MIAGTNGVAGSTYYVLSSTNAALPVASWTSVATNVFDAGGNFSFTNAVEATIPALFYLLESP